MHAIKCYSRSVGTDMVTWQMKSLPSTPVYVNNECLHKTFPIMDHNHHACRLYVFIIYEKTNRRIRWQLHVALTWNGETILVGGVGAYCFTSYSRFKTSFGVIENIKFYIVPVVTRSPPPNWIECLRREKWRSELFIGIIWEQFGWVTRHAEALQNHHWKIKPTWQITVMCNFYSQLYQTM